MSEPKTGRIYDAWSWAYDRTFTPLLTRRQQRAIAQLRLCPGDRVLDIGVGTGATLAMYPSEVTVVAMDLSAGMLAKAAEKQRDLGLTHTHLIRADAMLPPLAEASFDHIVITHVISVVSDPCRLLHWAQRLLRPGGRIVVLNHFQSPHAVVAWFEKALNPLFVKLGWRSNLSLEESLAGAELEVEYAFQLRRMDVWQIVVLTHRRPADASAPHVPAPLPLRARFRRPRLATGE